MAYTPGSEPTLFLGRGYTGHEHLAWFGLVNMNARLYDPALGRFLAPDPYIPNPFMTQDYNRYTYAMNNPLVYIDQDGEFPWLAVGIFLAYVYLKGAHDNTPEDKQGNPSNWNWNPFNWNWKDANYTLSIGNNTGSSRGPGGFIGVGWNGSTTNIGYNKKSGLGMGHSVNGNSNMFYPAYDYSKPEKGIAEALERATYQYRQYEQVKKDTAPQTNWGLYVAGTALTGEDIYSNFFHNHTTYTTTKGVVKDIYKPNGQVRSARAQQFSRTSNMLKYTGVAGTALMTGIAGYNIGTGNGNVLDYSDATVGVVGLAGAGASYLGYAIPGVGAGVAAYSWTRFWFDLGAKYGPSKWYGNDDTRWFK